MERAFAGAVGDHHHVDGRRAGAGRALLHHLLDAHAGLAEGAREAGHDAGAIGDGEAQVVARRHLGHGQEGARDHADAARLLLQVGHDYLTLPENVTTIV